MQMFSVGDIRTPQTVQTGENWEDHFLHFGEPMILGTEKKKPHHGLDFQQNFTL